MRPRDHGGVVMLLLLSILADAWASPVSAQDGIAQYRAALTKVFLSKYQAFPILHQNPIYPGTVLRLDEKIHFAPDRCYSSKQGGQYVEIDAYREGITVSRRAEITVGGVLVSKYLAEIEAEIRDQLAVSTLITVSPLSIDRFKPDMAALRRIKSVEECKLILELIDGKRGGFLVVAEVLHGTLVYVQTVRQASQAGASAQGRLGAIIAKVFRLKESSVEVHEGSVRFAVAGSNAPQTRAVRVEKLNAEELARVTYFLQGKRGAELEDAVKEALTAAELAAWQKATNRIRALLGDEISRKEHWAERFTSGESMVKVWALREQPEKVDFNRVATYAAAMELVGKPYVAPAAEAPKPR